MWRGRAAEVGGVLALATIVTAMIAAPVLRAPSEVMFGMGLVGRHHDPFTVMAQWARPIGFGGYSQPVTDLFGAWIARVVGVVAAYNWVILISFPLSAAAAYLLARYLMLARAGAAFAAMTFAFSPFHVAQAAYHPHVAQTQWIPLYLLALWRCMDRASPLAIGGLGAATIAVTLSNFYGGFIAAVITPVAVLVYWAITRGARSGSAHRLLMTAGSLAIVGGAVLAHVTSLARAMAVGGAAFAFPRADLFRYGAKWWSFLMPPVAHPLLGDIAQRAWYAAGVREGLLEQQVGLGWSMVALALVGVVTWCSRAKRGLSAPSVSRAPVLMTVAGFALICSLPPEWTIGTFTFMGPSSLLYEMAPMFRSYARFGIVVQLMATLLAGIGLDHLLRAGARHTRVAGLVLAAMAAGEYAVSPSTQSRDVLPTKAHRWVVTQTNAVKVFDCAPFNQESESVQWLSGHLVTMGGPTSDCTEPNLPEKLAALGYTHLLVQRGTPDGQWFAAHVALDGLRLAASFDDGRVFAVATRTPAIYTKGTAGFSAREHDADRSWQWMGTDAVWTVVNTTSIPIIARLDLEIASFDRARWMNVRLDAHSAQTLIVDQDRRAYSLGPITLPPGEHELLFHPADPPTVVRDVIHNADARPLSFAFGAWNWTVSGGRP